MATAATSLLGLALPVQGELSGSWGDTVNNSITNLLDAAVAGTTTLNTDADVTLTTTTLAANQAREAILLCTGARTALRTITAPARSKMYVVINATTGGFGVKLVGAGPTTGVTIPAGSSRVVAWNGTDFVATGADAASITGVLAVANGGTGVTASTGTGSVVLSTSPTLVTPALGTPASGTVTNLTGTASININGTVGATTPAAGSFTNITGSANAVISVTDNVNAALRITQLGTGNALLVEDSANPDATPFVVDATGNVGIGETPTAATNLYVSKAITGATVSYGMLSSGVIQSDVTSNSYYFRTNAQTAASAFTLTAINHYGAAQGTIGAGSTVTNQYGFVASLSLTGATNNYGFFSSIPAAANRYNIYAQGTADNYFAGSVGIGGTPTAATNLYVSKDITGSTDSTGVYTLGIIQSDVTTTAAYFRTNAQTAASAFTLGTISHYRAAQGTIGAGSTVTNQYGFITSVTLTGATNNYGFFSNIPAAANRYNIYSSGTADNYFAGKVGIGTTAPASSLHVRQDQDGITRTIIQNRNGTGTPISELTFITGAFDLSDNRYAYIQSLGSGSNSLVFGTGSGAAPTERMRLDNAGNFTVSTGAVVVYQPDPAVISGTVTLTTTNIKAQIINTTGTTYTVTMPSGNSLEGVITWTAVNIGYDFTVINTASGTITMAVNTGVTSLGSLTIAASTSAQFRIRRTAADTFILYRLS
jgi:hypothetical protein